jgi:ADP-ribose pyrophosphatase YjhB (NUDIX family)
MINKENKVSYFVNELPIKPIDKPDYQILPYSQVEKLAKTGWQEVTDGFENPKLGSFIHSVCLKNNVPIYDFIKWEDGALNENGKAKGGVVIAPVEEKNGDYYIHCFWQYRHMLESWVLTVPGGFGRYSENKEQSAERESLEEAGLKLNKINFEQASVNRANVPTLINIGYATFSLSEQINPDPLEKLIGKMAIRIDKFPWTKDLLVNGAVAFARQDLDLIKSRK